MNTPRRFPPVRIVVLYCGLLLSYCMMGGSAEQGNARISGVITTPVQDVASCIEVQLVPEYYDPFEQSGGPFFSTMTDSGGTYSFDNIPFGSYYLFSFDSSHSLVLLDGPTAISSDQSDIFATTLKKASIVTVVDPGTSADTSVGYYLRGMSAIPKKRTTALQYLSLLGIPAGVHDVMRQVASATKAEVFTRALEIIPGDSIAISQHNRPPRIQNRPGYLPDTLPAAVSCTLSFQATDPDSDEVRYDLITPLAHGSIDSMSGTLIWTPEASESLLSGIQIKVSDTHGSYSVFTWNVILDISDITPEPLPPEGTAEPVVNSTIIYTVQAPDCSLYSCRFSWGNGDTSEFSATTTVRHLWTDTGTFNVQVQVQCENYAYPSKWSQPLRVKVLKTPTTPTPSIARSVDTIFGYDTVITDTAGGNRISDTLFNRITVTVSSLTCDSQALYRFYCNDETLTGWTTESELQYIPDSSGSYVFHVEAWCDTTVTHPSERSDPYIVFATDTLPAPVITGATLYSGEYDTLKFRITSATSISGTPVLHRFGLYTRSLVESADNSTRIALLSIADSCPDYESCGIPVNLFFDTYSQWYQGKSFYIVLQKAAVSYTLSIQARINDRLESAATMVVLQQE